MGLLSWMRGVKANTWVWMKNARFREPAIDQLPHARPIRGMPLTAPD